ncbi:ComEC/Rec2 family competence protein [Aquimarina sediminis]|uniref:ComEC/Rec2 family competence protein n=1 Tax=Aquimarina sediminis TaxID=2070536 RepID=UPI0013E8D057|nr:ComEC/Rec2 family competence protein [Aquimarina sediminis]
MKLINIPFVAISISTLTGILLGYYIDIPPKTIFSLFSITVCLLSFFWKQSKKAFSKGHFFSIVMIIVFISFGATLVTIHNPKSYSNHYSNYIDTNNLTNHKVGIQFYIKKRLKSTSYYNKYIISINYIENKVTQGSILLQIPKKNSSNLLDIGNTYTSFTTIQPISKPLNPNQFDYAKYMRTKNIYHKITLLPNQLVYNHKIEHSLLSIADQIRKNINQKLAKHSIHPRELSVINALLLGQRQDIDQETLHEYRDAGAIHILAVSGLHIGILLLILNFLLKPLNRFKKFGKPIKLVLSIIFIWSFAIIAGLSPSVLRAATMFSFLAIGIQIRSKTSIYNSLFVSIFILVCFNPLLLFSPGFQLSYLAVFSIVWIQPIIANLYHPRFYISKKLWDIFTVTLTAQLGLLPLSLFYFHQFPILFFVSNLILLPFLGILLGLGILVIMLASLNILPDCMATLFANCIETMNNFIQWIAQQETFIIRDIPFSWGMLIISYFTIIVSVLLIQKYERKKFYLMISNILIITITLVYNKQAISNKEELVIFHNQRNTTIGVLEKRILKVYSKSTITANTKGYLFGNYLISNQATIDSTFLLKNVYKYKEQVIFIIDSSSIYNIPKLQPDIVLLSNSPKIHLERVIDSLQPTQIVADASNYKTFLDQWEISCKKYNIRFYRTDKMGAFFLK